MERKAHGGGRPRWDLEETFEGRKPRQACEDRRCTKTTEHTNADMGRGALAGDLLVTHHDA
ncbi:hypothetical protein RRF57_006391 [Xylaria bambusicola]|uniref:Uncharacterized protein n=1 Tax=Xylaria bambusicola TaxID=326684 RepID=A0AAN7UQ63_9PEZI